MKNIALSANRSAEPIAWNDIEALPIYGAAALIIVSIYVAIPDLSFDLRSAALKTMGIVGGLALRYAWLGLQDARA